MKEENVLDALCKSIEADSRITSYELQDNKSNINTENGIMEWDIFAYVRLNSINTDISKYVKEMNEFINSFKFIHENNTLNPSYISDFARIEKGKKLIRGEIGYRISNAPIIYPKIEHWPQATMNKAKKMMEFDSIHIVSNIIIRPSIKYSAYNRNYEQTTDLVSAGFNIKELL